MKDKIKSKIFNTVKKKIMSDNQNNTQKKHADTVIRNHVIWSMGAGLIPVLIADIFAVSALQLDMIRQLCKVYNIDFEETRGKAIVTSLTSSTLARLGARSLVKLIPGVGSYLGGVTVSIFAGASTYALGEVFKMHFESGGTILDFDPDRVKKYYAEKFEKGKKVATEWKTEKTDVEDIIQDQAEEVAMPSAAIQVEEEVVPPPPPPMPTADPNDPIAKLKELAELKEAGVITDKEFTAMKKKLIDDF